MPPPRLLGAALIASVILVALAPAAVADTETHFLGPDGVPDATLIGTPDGGEMPNYDLGRDLQPGILLLRSANGAAETDATRFQQWRTAMNGRGLVGYPSLVIWAAGADFEIGVTGVFTTYLLDCPKADTSCIELGSATTSFETSSDWAELEVELPALDHPFQNGHDLTVRVVVSDRSDADLMFAYGYPAYRSRLQIDDEAPPPSTAGALYSLAPEDARLVPEVAEDLTLQIETADGTPSSTIPEGGFSSWLASTALSTLALIVLGLGLMATLGSGRKRGRHNIRTRGQHLAHSTRASHRPELVVSSSMSSRSMVGPSADW
jgi:hypothetical protein